MPNMTTNHGIAYINYLKYKIFYIPLRDESLLSFFNTFASFAVGVFLFIVYIKRKKTIFVNLNHSCRYKRN